MTFVEAAKHMRCTLNDLRNNEALLNKYCPVGLRVERSEHAYEVWRINGEGVSLIVYPHRTSAGHYHLRIRNNGSQDKGRARALLESLDNAAGYNCTFHCKTLPPSEKDG